MADKHEVVSDDEEVDVNAGRRPLESGQVAPAPDNVQVNATGLLHTLVVFTIAQVAAVGKYVSSAFAAVLPYAKFNAHAPVTPRPPGAGVGRQSAATTHWLKNKAAVSSMVTVDDYAMQRHTTSSLPSVLGPAAGFDYEPPCQYPVMLSLYPLRDMPISTRGPRWDNGKQKRGGADAFQHRVINIFSTAAVDEMTTHAVNAGNLKLVHVQPAHLQGEAPKVVYMSMLGTPSTGKPQINITTTCPRAYTEYLLYTFTDVHETGLEPNHLINKAMADVNGFSCAAMWSQLRRLPKGVLDDMRACGRDGSMKEEVLMRWLDDASPVHKWTWIAEHRAVKCTGGLLQELTEGIQFKVQASYLVWRNTRRIVVTKANGELREASARFPARMDLSHKAALFESPSLMAGYVRGWQLEVALAERINLNQSRNACTALLLPCLERPGPTDMAYTFIRPCNVNVASACPHLYDPCWGPVIACVVGEDHLLPSITQPPVEAQGKEPPATGAKKSRPVAGGMPMAFAEGV